MVAERGQRGVIARLSGQTSRLFQRWIGKRIPAAREIRLNHRRIFIVPTRAGLALLVLLVIMLLGAINYQNSLVYALTFLLVSLFWVGLHHTYRNLAGLELRATGSRPVFVGESAPLSLTLAAVQHEHQALALYWPRTQPQRLDVEAGQETTVTLYHPVHQRGWFRPGRLRVETRYPLGWFVAWSLVDLNWQVLVYPKPLVAALPRQGAGGDGDGALLNAEGVDDFQGLRAYQPGDSRRRLDWRAWSRGQGLHSKVFAEPSQNSLWLVLDSAPGQDLEQRLGYLTGWVLELERRGQPYGLQLGSQRLGPALGEAHRDACLKTLALYGVAA
ncbi:DUF58 domain-containing protein [Halopseudomonas phragmitis]|uniref:DUF58 domain-containing protein n=1 Tax=Halopseudomonas phragmitis TaxID=1931241 RepID=A0A1V0BA61_9GAMM|nr:DUF58 domain-containing protein [Halopseudomonas phragmitis]AQZ96826.1 hypothetical protein BVH74_13260 [Halopseudomonas phragmitis]